MVGLLGIVKADLHGYVRIRELNVKAEESRRMRVNTLKSKLENTEKQIAESKEKEAEQKSVDSQKTSEPESNPKEQKRPVQETLLNPTIPFRKNK
jgi:hypothetical protein